MSLSHCLALFLLFGLDFCLPFSVPKLVGLPKYKLTAIEKCKSDNKESIRWNIVLNNVDSDGWKSCDMDLELTRPFDNSYSYTLAVDTSTNGDWNLNTYQRTGKLCDLIQQFVKRAWKKMASEIKPKLTNICYVDKGKYKLENFQLAKNDVDFPVLFGMLRVRLNFFNGNKENVLCLRAYAEIAS